MTEADQREIVQRISIAVADALTPLIGPTKIHAFYLQGIVSLDKQASDKPSQPVEVKYFDIAASIAPESAALLQKMGTGIKRPDQMETRASATPTKMQ